MKMRVLTSVNSELLECRLNDLLTGINKVEISIEQLTNDNVDEIMKKLKPQVVIMDLYSGNGNNKGLLRAIKRINPEINLIILSTNSIKEYCDECLGTGADFCYDISTQFDDLMNNLEKLMKTKYYIIN